MTAVAEEPVTLYCNITGFDNNLPAMEFAWYKDDLFIPRDHPRYYMTRAETSIKLVIKEPSKCDEILSDFGVW